MNNSVFVENNTLIQSKLNEAAKLEEWNYNAAVCDFLLENDDISADEAERFFSETFSNDLLSAEHALFCRIFAEIAGEKLIFFTDESDEHSDGTSKISYLKNAYSDKAYKAFSEVIANASALYYQSFREVCEEVYYGRAKYAILPLFTSEDGSLSSFRKLYLKYDLKIVCTVKIETDGENYIEFALFGKALSTQFGNKKRNVILSVIPDSPEQIGIIICSAEKVGANIISVNTYTVDYSVTESCFDIRLSIDENNLNGLYLFLECSHIRYNIIGNFAQL